MPKKITRKRLSRPNEKSSAVRTQTTEARENSISEFQNLGLSYQLSAHCAQVGWEHPSTVQKHCIPRLLSPCDHLPAHGPNTHLSPFIFGMQAPPGSGKTASYILPILHHLMNSSSKSFLQPTGLSQTKHAPTTLLHFLSTLIVAPTTELCLQIYNQLLLFGESVRLKLGLLVGGGTRKGATKSNFREQLGMVQDRTVHVIIGTPGRVEYVLLDSSIVAAQTSSDDSDDSSSGLPPQRKSRGDSVLKNLHFLVFDEADMMMNEASMVRGIQRLLECTTKAQHDGIMTQRVKASAERAEESIQQLPLVNLVLVSATLKHSTVNSIWAQCVKALNTKMRRSGSNTETVSSICDEESLDIIDFASPESFEKGVAHLPPLPMIYVANDSMSVDNLTANSFNSFVEQQFMLVPDHVKLVHLYLLLSPSSEFSIVRTFARRMEIESKRKLLKSTQSTPNRKVIIFLNSKAECEVIRTTLQLLGLSVCSLHSLQTPQQRSDSLFSFQMSVHPILLTTDVCCRGLDIASVDFIIHYDIPRTIDRYVHRIGRARRESQVHGKGGSSSVDSGEGDESILQGQSILFATEKDKAAFRKLEKSIAKIMRRRENECASAESWKLTKRKEINEELILRNLDVVLQARLQAEDIFSNEFEKEEVKVGMH